MTVIEVAIGPGVPGTFKVEVVASPAGEASATVELDADALLARRGLLQQAVLASAVPSRRVLPETEQPLREIGELLFAALLGTGEVARRYSAAAAVAAERGEGLRVVLRIDTPALAGLPWEAMFDQGSGAYVCRTDQLVRHVPVASVPTPLPVRAPLRILGVVSSPRGLPALDVDKEQDQLARALTRPVGQGLAELHWASAATWADLQDLLLDGEWHALHFIGHGDFDYGRDEGMLVLEREDRRADLVGAHRLVDLLRQARPMPRLVVLNSCSGAAAAADDLFSSTAAALVRGGVSAVAAMQYEISDRAAVAFARGFYGAIARGRGVDDAISSGRVAILGLSDHTLEWVTPVLYLRGHDTCLFTLQAPADQAGALTPQPLPTLVPVATAMSVPSAYDADMSGESERETRIRRIDPRLQRADWTLQNFRSIGESKLARAAAIREYPTASGPADYALCDDGHVRAVVEAKRLTVGTQEVMEQAKRYSRGIAQEPQYQGQYHVPFLYSTNGEIIHFLDTRSPLNLSREIARFHTVGALAELLSRNIDAELARLGDIPFSSILRPYQVEANQAIDQALRERRRKMLLTMATGTGKTLVTVSEVYRLMKSGAARRVLFLVDRRALAAQAVRAFASFEAEPGLKFDRLYPVYSQRFQPSDLEEGGNWDPKLLPANLITNPKAGDTFVYVSTIQRMSINLFGKGAALSAQDDEGGEEDATQLNIPIHAFDLIIADECHRGYTGRQESIWRDTLNYFDAITIGLTATPAAHTLAQFEHIAYRYEYERAVREGNLVDYDPVRIKSGVRINGVFLQAGDRIDNIDPESGTRELDILEDERTYPSADIEQRITVPDSNRRILTEIKRYADEHQREYGRFPKTLIFAAQDLPHRSHADQLVRQAREIFGRGEDFVAKITGKVDRPLQRIREFRNRPNPGIVVSVDLMTTGVDIPDLEYIVLLRPIRSRILFEQILGRGTRRGEQHRDKSHFVVFDCFDGTLLEFFRATTGMTIEPPTAPTRTVAQIIDDIWQNRNRDYNVRALVKRLQRINKEMSGEATELFSRFIVNGDVGAFAADLPRLVDQSFAQTMGIMRDPDFQNLLENYPRANPPFVSAPGVIDTVESEWLIQAGAGREYKPNDYLTAFNEFVRTHETDIQALQILLHRPADWNPAALKQLTETLKTTPEHFSEANLRRAFRAARHRDLVDIISMVKHAAEASSPLMTAEERVNAAVGKVTADRDLTADEAQWMEYIRLHLVQNLSIDREDFEAVPVLSSRGGWGRANRVFGGQLEQIIADLNRELVAA